MGNQKRFFYAVAVGFTPGIYGDWGGVDGAEYQVRGYSNAVHKKFRTLSDAKKYMEIQGVEHYLMRLN